METLAELMKYVPSLLIVIGAVFLLLAFGATVLRMQLVPFKTRVATGIIGTVLLMLGIVLYLTPPPPPPTPTPPPTETPTTNTPVPTATEAPTSTPTPGFEVIKLTSTVHAGDEASVTIRTAAGTLCELAYETPAGTESKSDDLKAKVAGNDGLCSWTWKIAAQTKPGTGTLTITANGATESYAIVIK